jgi:hypothetical protein
LYCADNPRFYSDPDPAQALRLRDGSSATVRRSSHEFSSGLAHRNRTYLPNRK